MLAERKCQCEGGQARKQTRPGTGNRAGDGSGDGSDRTRTRPPNPPKPLNELALPGLPPSVWLSSPLPTPPVPTPH